MSQRESEAGSAFVPGALLSSAASSGMVISAFSSMLAMRNLRCGSSLAWRRPPLGLGVRLPVARKLLISLTTKETDTLNARQPHDMTGQPRQSGQHVHEDRANRLSASRITSC